MSGYCATCNNTGSIDCHCGGDLCVCGQEEIECPECCGGFAEDDDYEEGFDAGEWNNTPVDRGNAITKAQEAARAADPRPSEEIIREQRGEWDRY